jgi:hypothetical protein
MKIHQISLFAENKPGHIAAPSRLLAKEGIDIRALYLADTEQYGIVRMIVSDWQKAAKTLEDHGFVVKVTEVLAVEVIDHPGGLADVLGALDGTGINIEYMYAFPDVRGDEGNPDLSLRRSGCRDCAIAERQASTCWTSEELLKTSRPTTMPVSKTIAGQLENASWIRRMFEEGVRMKRERGADAVFDFSLGNPDVEPPPAVLDALRRVVAGNRPGSHGYMPNPGYSEVREAVAKKLQQRDRPGLYRRGRLYDGRLRGRLQRDPEVDSRSRRRSHRPDALLSRVPVLYRQPRRAHGSGRNRRDVSARRGAHRAAITPRTRAILLNTPNNPTGRVYPESVLRDLHAMLARAGQPITVISDEPYKSFVYDGSGSPRWRRSSPIRRSATRGRSRWDCRASASATWRSRRNWRMPQSARRLRLQQSHSGFSSTRPRSGSG